MNIQRHRATKLVAAGITLAAIVATVVPAHAQYLRSAPYGYGYVPYGGYGAYGYAPYGGYGAYGSFGYYLPYNYEYYLPSDQHRFYDRSSTDFNS
jgi:hypothetical protein